MDQPGVEVRPIKMITGDSEFNEVFFTDARCPKENVVGEVNSGWAVAMTLLGYERGEAAATFPLHVPRRARPPHRARPGARARPTTPSSASAWRGATRKVEIMRYLGMRDADPVPRTATTPARTRRSSSCTGASTTRLVTELAVDILGADAMVPTGRWPAIVVPDRRPGRAERQRRGSAPSSNARAGTIYAGHEPDPAQHPRRDGARPAQGAQAPTLAPGASWPAAPTP